MELRQLEYFVTVAEEANFTRAAERVHISQSGVSAQVKALENELGADLFDRSGRSATLTPAGKAALPHARTALAAADAMRGAVDEVNGLVRGHLTAGMVKGCEVAPWFAALAGFHRRHPGIGIELREDNSDVLIAEVRAGSSDIALVGIAGKPPPGLAVEIIISEGLAAIVGPDHPLAAARGGQGDAGGGRKRDEGIGLAELVTYPLVALPQGTGIRSVLDQAAAAAGHKPHIALEASSPTAVADLGARGLGVAVLSRSMAAGLTATHPDMAAIPIAGIDIPALLALVWRPRPSPAVRAFLTNCRAAFEM
ncbi:LysR family transcriptional regulator [Actinoplanes sp. NPDC051633]|uniref:LysR family transcriptional regulator n=1 Tax=Actinoplanes sp. NPDC051633 TaxID=3155670 RepID=UPI00341DE057